MVQRIAKSGTQLKRLWTHTLTVKEMLRLFNKRRFLCVECLGLVTTFNGYHSSYVYLRYKLSKTHLRNINVGWRRLAWKQKNTLRVDKYSRICISSSSNKQESDPTKRYRTWSRYFQSNSLEQEAYVRIWNCVSFILQRRYKHKGPSTILSVPALFRAWHWTETHEQLGANVQVRTGYCRWRGRRETKGKSPSCLCRELTGCHVNTSQRRPQHYDLPQI